MPGMKSQTVTLNSLEELSIAAKRLLEFANDKRFIAFFGEMGSGKTTFINSICKELGVKGRISSPTFSLVNEYITSKDDLIYHFDFYRIKNEKEALDIGVEEYFDSGHYCLVEWPENILNLLPKEFVKVNLRVDDKIRILTFQDE